MGKSKRTRRKPARAVTLPVDEPVAESTGVGWIYAAIIFAFALVTLIFGMAHYGSTLTASRAVHELRTAPAALGQPDSTDAILSGRIEATATPIAHGLVAYVTERYNTGGKYSSPGWWRSATSNSTFAIVTPAGSMRLANTDYELGLVAPIIGYEINGNWDHRDHRVALDAGTWTSAGRLRGLVAGGAVTAVGTVTADGTFHARYVIGASREDVIERLQPIADGRTSTLSYWLTIIGLAGLIATFALYARMHLRR